MEQNAFILFEISQTLLQPDSLTNLVKVFQKVDSDFYHLIYLVG